MEEDVFLSPAVAGLMNEHLVEGRLHTDTQNTLTAEQFARNRELQAELAGTKANPTFVFVDPKSGDKIGVFNLDGDFTTWAGKWSAFVEDLAEKHGRK